MVWRASVESTRGKMSQTSGRVIDQAGNEFATAEGKYLALANDRHQAFMATLVDEASTAEAARKLRFG